MATIHVPKHKGLWRVIDHQLTMIASAPQLRSIVIPSSALPEETSPKWMQFKPDISGKMAPHLSQTDTIVVSGIELKK